MGDVLKQSSAASSGAGSAVWGLYADYYAALGFHASAREALLKQARLRLGNRKLLCWILVPERLVAGQYCPLQSSTEWRRGPCFRLKKLLPRFLAYDTGREPSAPVEEPPEEPWHVLCAQGLVQPVFVVLLCRLVSAWQPC